VIVIRHEHYFHIDGDDARALKSIQETLAQLTRKVDHIIMTTAEAFAKAAADTEQLKKAFSEIRAKIDAQTALIEQLQNTTLTPEQEKIVTDLDTATQALDDVVPDAPTA
jgi:hypothetical protein